MRHAPCPVFHSIFNISQVVERPHNFALLSNNPDQSSGLYRMSSTTRCYGDDLSGSSASPCMQVRCSSHSKLSSSARRFPWHQVQKQPLLIVFSLSYNIVSVHSKHIGCSHKRKQAAVYLRRKLTYSNLQVPIGHTNSPHHLYLSQPLFHLPLQPFNHSKSPQSQSCPRKLP